MSISDYESPERREKIAQATNLGAKDPEFEALFGMDSDKLPFSPALLPSDPKEEQALMLAADGLVNVAANEQYPRKLSVSDSPFLKNRRERFIRHLIQAGKPDYAERVKELMVTYQDLSTAELDQNLLKRKVAEYNEKSFDLIIFIDTGELLAGNSDNKRQSGKGILELAMEDLFAEKRQKAEEEIVKHQTALGITKSNLSLSDRKVEDWIINNVEEYRELRYDLAVAASITRTYERFRWQINRAASSNERLIMVYPK